MKIVISSGHGKLVRGATWNIDEVDEARKVVNEVASFLATLHGVKTEVFHDDVSKSQNENLNRIVNFHNAEGRELDVSVHFNAYEPTGAPMGVEVLHLTQNELATRVAAKISAAAGLKNRGAKKRTDLFFLNKTTAPAILIEVCFVDSKADTDLYQAHFNEICMAIADALSGQETGQPPISNLPTPIFKVSGKASSFGGPDDQGVSQDEGLAFIHAVEDCPHIFLPFQPKGTSGLARRLNPHVHYVACRWDYVKTPKAMLREEVALVCSPDTGMAMKAFPADWGPNEATGRVADLSPSLMDDLGIETDWVVEVIFPFTS
jgi:N-acetylmuramoyl-L-alanine amidase